MKKKPTIPLPLRILRFFFRRNNRYKTTAEIRWVYFGLRARFIAALGIVSALTVGGLTVSFRVEQQRLLREEHRKKTRLLTKILSTPAALYLDTGRNADAAARKIKLEAIKQQATAFARLNPDLVKIQLTDRNGKLKFSSHFSDWQRYSIPPYIRSRLSRPAPGLGESQLKLRTGSSSRLLTVLTHPVTSDNPMLQQLPEDFHRYGPRMASASPSARRQLDRALRYKYRSLLPAAAAADTNCHGYRLWLTLFRSLRFNRPIPVPPGEQPLWQQPWLDSLLRQKQMAFKQDRAAVASAIEQQITNRLHKLAVKISDCRLLGYLAVIFDPSGQSAGLDANLKRGLTVAGVMFLLSIAAAIFALRRVIREIRQLEEWAVAVSNGDLQQQTDLSSRDELGRLGDLLNHMLSDIKVKYELEKYVSKSTKSHLKKNSGKGKTAEPGTTGRRELVFLFSDVRGFTSFSEQHDPETVISVLNRYLEIQSEIIHSLRGDIDDYVGDAVMAHFSGETRADRALEAAERIRDAIAAENALRKKSGAASFDIGIGIHGGEVVTGNIGSRFRMDFACVGDAVNLASRLCSAAGAGEVIISDQTAKLLQGDFPLKKGPPVTAKGKAEPVKIHLLGRRR